MAALTNKDRFLKIYWQSCHHPWKEDLKLDLKSLLDLYAKFQFWYHHQRVFETDQWSSKRNYSYTILGMQISQNFSPAAGYEGKPTKSYFKFLWMESTTSRNMRWVICRQWKRGQSRVFASVASGPQKIQKFDLVGRNWSSTGKKNTFER